MFSMTSSNRSIFREDAYKRHLQKQKQSIILRLATPPVWIFAWLLLLCFLGASLLAWRTQVPVFVGGQGILTRQNSTHGAIIVAVLFVPVSQQKQIHPGQAVELRVGPKAASLRGVVASLEPRVMSPLDIRTRFQLQGESASMVAEPSVTATIRLDAPLSANLYAGSTFSARVQVGSQSVLSLLPGLNQLVS
ncbi:hypothetical protein [Ktedonobacter sp. SOSP1-85]|uniref:hypothetical protein n=1 Tax=Ktedonobacter sp. SOSP1-85 TaxID=2778367 RepID=UPI001915C9B3|nr:hypothetical protein [Ktedonobacter sp. SOSP1-85]